MNRNRSLLAVLHGVLFAVFFAVGAVGCDGVSVVGGPPRDGGIDAPAMDVTCASGQRLCDGRCVDDQTDTAHCGACANRCGAGQVCVAGACRVHCPGIQSVCAGLCINLETDTANCGACGNACSTGQMCNHGRCALTCGASLATCGGGDAGIGDASLATYCADTRSDNHNCGACGNLCGAGQLCVDSACRLSCAAGQVECNGACRDLQTDAANCGACGNGCPSGNACVAGVCRVTCTTGLTECSGACVNLQTDNANCGACSNACGAGTMCSNGTCRVTCQAPQVECSGRCTNLANDPLHCGACATVCSGANATAFCASGRCAVACNTGFGDCDHSAVNGCEVDTRSSNTHCGACGHACTTGATCSNGGCVCPTGQRLVGSGCVAESALPRQISPLSLSDVTQRRPTLRWVLPAGFDGAVIELCSDRACATVIETVTASGTSVRPSSELPARSVVFWRIRGRLGGATDSRYSATWLFHTPAVSAATGVDTSFNPHLDVNGDGYDDVAASGAVAPDPPRVVRVFHGGASGVASTPTEMLSRFGLSIAGAGDVNGDGYGDLVVGDPHASSTGHYQSGFVAVFLGSATGLSTTPLREIEGADVDDFGTSVAGAGDVNLDGYADVIFGAPQRNIGGRPGRGEARIYHGNASGISAAPVSVLMGDMVMPGQFSQVPGSFGASVATAGDVNGDGYSDVIVGAVWAHPDGRFMAGTASVFHGSATGVSLTPARVYEGSTANDQLGNSVASAGDVNGDGYADVVVGDSNLSPGGRTNSGAASVFHGSATGVSLTPARVLEGGAVREQFGYSVASAGDVNGDGFADLVIGTPYAAPGGRTDAGAVSVFHGSATGVSVTPARVVEGAVVNGQLGWAVAGAGDVNRDGFADLVVGAPNGRPGAGGAASVFHGNATGVSQTPAQVLAGSPGENFGRSVARRGGSVLRTAHERVCAAERRRYVVRTRG